LNTASNPSRPKFPLGQIVATPGASDALTQACQTPHEFLARHVSGDWGDVCPDDWKLNDEALIDGSRLLSSYVLRSGVRIWCITEAADDNGQRAATTLLLPEEY
jgi:hypothetical protein